MGNRETMEIVIDFNFGGSEVTAAVMTAAMKLKDACSLEEICDQPRQHIKTAETLLGQQRSV